MSAAPPEQMTDALRAVRASAFNPNLLSGIAIIYMKACLLASLTLFVSTFASTNIFTIMVMVFVYFIGHLQATAREYWLQTQSAGWIAKIFLAFVALLFPDLQLFNVADDIVAGAAIPLALFGKNDYPRSFFTREFICFSPGPSFIAKNYDALFRCTSDRGAFWCREIAGRARHFPGASQPAFPRA